MLQWGPFSFSAVCLVAGTRVVAGRNGHMGVLIELVMGLIPLDLYDFTVSVGYPNDKRD